MKTIVLAASVAAAILAGTGPAHAEPFKGPYLGADVAYEDYTSSPNDDKAIALIGGWDFELAPRWIAGVAARVTVDGTDTSETTPAPGDLLQTSEVRLKNQFGVSGRVGRIIGRNLLLFAEGGYERFEVDAVRTLRAQVCAPPSGCVISRTDFSFKEDMVTVGAGAELSLTDWLSLRATYTYGESDAFKRNRAALAVSFRF